MCRMDEDQNGILLSHLGPFGLFLKLLFLGTVFPEGDHGVCSTRDNYGLVCADRQSPDLR